MDSFFGFKVWILISWLHQKPADLDPHYFQKKVQNLKQLCQGWHRLEKYLNIQDCLEKSLKIIFALKST